MESIKGKVGSYQGKSEGFKERSRRVKELLERKRLQRWPGSLYQPTFETKWEGMPFRSPSGLLDREPLEVRSPVAIVKAKDYDDAETAVRKAIKYLGGPKTICKKGDKVLVKPNLVFPAHPDMAETTHPAVVAAVVKVLKETGATIWIGEQSAWHASAEIAYDVTGIRKAALEAGADEVINWEQPPRVDVEIPGGRSIKKANVHKSVIDCDVFVQIPKLKVNFVQGKGGMTLAIKHFLGFVPNEDRYPFHKTELDMAWVCCDIAKIVVDKHRLTLLDGIYGMEGSGPHAGLVTHPQVIVASPDMVAVEAIGHIIAGFHPMTNPTVQVAMKDGLGTGELAEMQLMGERIEDVIHPFKNFIPRYVQKYMNITEFFGGGICPACLWPALTIPPVVDPKKEYAIIAGPRVGIGQDLTKFDEIWLVGQCATSPSHQYPDYAEKIKAAQKGGTEIYRMSTCSGYDSLMDPNLLPKLAKGTIYETTDLLAADMCVVNGLPECVRPDTLAEVEARREGHQKDIEQNPVGKGGWEEVEDWEWW